ncbi:MAG: cold shock domain-containing protein [Bacteroidales bacterium]|jgi:CspA family cold shock protein
MQGLVKFFNSHKGFGFIKTDEYESEIYVHVSSTLDKIKEGDLVEFELGENSRGACALKVHRVKN